MKNLYILFSSVLFFVEASLAIHYHWSVVLADVCSYPVTGIFDSNNAHLDTEVIDVFFT